MKSWIYTKLAVRTKKDITFFLTKGVGTTTFAKLSKQIHVLKKENKNMYHKLIRFATDYQQEVELMIEREWESFKQVPSLYFFALFFYVLIDVYTIARMMKKSLRSKIVVVFAGDDHIDLQKRFFEKVLDLKPIFSYSSRQKINWKQHVSISSKQWQSIRREVKKSLANK